jgi:D-sedoheptulose 7-phosphate isomerase
VAVAGTVHAPDLSRLAMEAFARRRAAGLDLVGQAQAVALACRDIAQRFAAGGTLLAFGAGPSATDAHHLAVEFLHPVIVGKRALPAIALTTDAATLTGIASREGWPAAFARQLEGLASSRDIAIGLCADDHAEGVIRALALARARGLLTVALLAESAERAGGAVDHRLTVPATRPTIVKEVQVTTYHLLWELVHVFLEHGDVAGPRARS